jgi:glycosyltransferase involved in cell wall biosynthesis
VQPLSITHVDTETAWRGGQQSLLTLARGLRDRGHTQRIVSPADSALTERAQAQGFEVTTKCPRSGDIVHAHSGQAHNMAVRATLGASITRIVTRHVAFQPRHPLVHRLKYTKTCDGIIAVSAAVRNVLTEAGIPADRIEVIHTGIELPVELAPRPHKGFAVGHMGAFTREKGQDIAIEAARLLPDVYFVLAGEGPLLDDLRRAAPSNVVFPGFVRDLAEFFSGLDLFIMPSRSEAWGLATLEAMAYGVPVIVSDIEGLSEIVTPQCGLLVPPGNAEMLAQAIANIDRVGLSARREAARARAAEFTVAKMAEQTETFYRRVHRLS